MSDTAAFDYANVTGRPAGRVVSVAGRVLPGVGAVQRQVQPYAQAWRTANLASLQRGGRRWIVLGDSMSQGVGASSFDAGWVNQVHRQLADVGVNLEIVNLSASGARVVDVLDQQLPAWRSLPAATSAMLEPDLITLLIGSNDLMSRSHRDRLPATFAQVLAALEPGALVATLPQPRSAARATNVAIEAARAAGRIVVVDMRRSGPSSWRGKLAADHFHPNDAGYRAIADAFVEPMRSALQSGD